MFTNIRYNSNNFRYRYGARNERKKRKEIPIIFKEFKSRKKTLFRDLPDIFRDIWKVGPPDRGRESTA